MRNISNQPIPHDATVEQLNKELRRTQRELQNLPLYYGDFDPQNNVLAQAGSIFIRTTKQGKNTAEATPHIYIKTSDNTRDGWLSLLFLGSGNPAGNVVAMTGSILLDVLTGTLYKKTTGTGSANGWSAV